MKKLRPLKFQTALFLFGLLLSPSLFAQPVWKFQDFPVGLEADDITELIVVSDNEYWLSTDQGLYHYDSGVYTHYTSSNSALLSDQINDVVEHNGVIWAATGNGLAEFDGSNFSIYQTADGLLKNQILSLASDPNGDLYIGTNIGVSNYDGTGFTTTVSTNAQDLAMGSNGVLWILSDKNVLPPNAAEVYNYDGSTLNPVITSTISSDAMLQPRIYGASNGDIYITSILGGYAWFDGSTWQQQSATGLQGSGVFELAVSASGVVWAGMTTASSVGGFRAVDGSNVEIHNLSRRDMNMVQVAVYDQKVYGVTPYGIVNGDENIKTFNDYEVLDLNNIHAGFNSDGSLFTNMSNGFAPAFEMNPGNGVHGIFTGELWVSSEHQGDIRAAADLYNGVDYVAGSVMESSAIYRNSIFKITRQQIDDHIANHAQSGYVMPEVIADWPANGDFGLGEAADMAPFHDVNNNGCYDPENGDYPYIKGDQAIYFIYNDSLSSQEGSGGDPIGLEVHGMAYAHEDSSVPELENTIFVDFTLINRSNRDYDSVKAGMFADFDLGNPVDDYVGCNPAENMFFVYNGDAVDESGGGFTGFGNNPPALAVKVLSHPLDHFMYMENSSGVRGLPQTDLEYHHYLDARWRDGNTLTLGASGYNPGTGAPIHRYMFDGDPLTNIGWTDFTGGHTPGDRRGLGSAPFFSLPAGARQSVEFALFYAHVPGDDNLQNANNLIAMSQAVKQFYDNQPTVTPTLSSNHDCDETIGIEDAAVAQSQISLFPNPSTGMVQIASDETIQSINIYAVTGQQVDQITVGGQKQFQLQLSPQLESGIYLVEWISVDGQRGTSRLSLQR